MLVRSIAMGLALSLAAASPAGAVQQLKSRYTTVDLSKCERASGEQAAKAWVCPGLPGFPLYISVAGQRTFISPGPKAAARRSARQSLVAPSTLFDGKSRRAAIEWRFVIRDKRVVPYATIIRLFTQGSTGRGEVIVVTKIADLESCQVARIDALATGDAMVLARSIADRKARAFDCEKEPEIVGSAGKSAM